MVRLYRRVNRYVPALSMVFFLLGLAALGIHLGCISSPTFADAFNGHVSSFLRIVLARLTGWIPFSLAEFLLLGSPVILVAVIVLACRKGARSRR